VQILLRRGANTRMISLCMTEQGLGVELHSRPDGVHVCDIIDGPGSAAGYSSSLSLFLSLSLSLSLSFSLSVRAVACTFREIGDLLVNKQTFPPPLSHA
jgi:hypothetical protein